MERNTFYLGIFFLFSPFPLAGNIEKVYPQEINMNAEDQSCIHRLEDIRNTIQNINMEALSKDRVKDIKEISNKTDN